MPRVPLLGGAYSASGLIANAQRSVNLFPEINPQESKAPAPVTDYVRPGLTPLSSPPAPGQGRCLYRATNGNLYAVVGQSVYYIDPNFTWTLLGALVTSASTPVFMADDGTDAVVVDGSPQGYDINFPAGTMTQIGDPNYIGSDRVDYLDTFLIFNQPGTPNWYCTLSNQIVFNALFFGVKTAWPDDVIAVIAIERQALILGPQKGEVWTNAGTSPFPFQALSSIIIEHGCAAKYSVAKQDVNAYWLSQSPEGDRMLMEYAQQHAERVSTHAIEQEWKKYTRVDDAIGSVYQINGHAFYRIDFPTADKTWVYDKATKQWFEDNWVDSNGNLHRARNTFCAFAYGRNLGLDWATGQLYQIDQTNFTDNGNPIVCVRSFIHMLDEEDDRVTYWRFIADIEVGTATGAVNYATTTTPWSLGFSAGFGPRLLLEPPFISLRCSRDRGASWGSRVMQPMGAAGLYYTRPTWNRLGYAADMVFELSWSTPMKTSLNGAFVVFEKHEGDY